MRSRGFENNVMTILFVFLIVSVFLFTGSTMVFAQEQAAQNVNIPDANLRAELEKALGKGAGDPITAADMQGLYRFSARGHISDLTGLESAVNLTYLNLGGNNISNIEPLAGLINLSILALAANDISNLAPLAGLTNLTRVSLGGNNIGDVSPLENLNNLTELALASNKISNIEPLVGLTSLTRLVLNNNPLDARSFVWHIPAFQRRGVTVRYDSDRLVNIPDVNLRAKLEKAFGKGAGAPITAADMKTLRRFIATESGISDLTGLGYAVDLEVLGLVGNSISDISALENLTSLTDLQLRGNPISDYGPLRRLKAANPGVTIDIDLDNNIPTFSDGDSTTRSIAENTASGQNIGAAVAAIDADNDTLTYSLGGTDAASFSIVSTSGQLQTSAALDYETQTSYTVTVTVYDGNSGGDSITVTINVTEVTPVNQRTQQVQEAIVGAVPGVTDPDDVTTTPLAAIPSLDLTNKGITSLQPGDFDGLTSLTILYLWNNSISDISALDGLTSLTHLTLSNNSISDISALENLTALTRLTLSNNSISDISALENLTALTNLNLSFNSISDISTLENLTALTRLDLSGNSISDISALENLTALTHLYLWGNSISDISALEKLTALTTLDLESNSISDISVLEKLTALTALELRGNPISDYEPLRRLKAANPDVSIDINLNNNPPVFSDGASTTRTVAENTAPGRNIGAAVSATDADSHRLTYSLGGTDAASFHIIRTSGQLQTKAALDYETKTSYTVTVTVYDRYSGGDRITVTINVTDVQDAQEGAAPSVETPSALPQRTELLSNFPNPFNPETWIPYQLATPSDVTITIYDVRGRIVRTLILGNKRAGTYKSRSKAAHWDGHNHFGEKVATGVYFYTLTAGDFSATRRMLILK